MFAPSREGAQYSFSLQNGQNFGALGKFSSLPQYGQHEIDGAAPAETWPLETTAPESAASFISTTSTGGWSLSARTSAVSPSSSFLRVSFVSAPMSVNDRLM